MTAPPRPSPFHTAIPFDRTAVDRSQATDPDVTKSTEQKFSLSATQVMASMAAAVTAALVGSRLGVAGTVIGAGLASVISVVGGAVIGHSILLTRNQVKRAVLQVRGSDPEEPGVVDHDALTVVLRATPGPWHAEPGRPKPTRPRRRVNTGVLLGVAAALAIFVSALGAVTVFETIKGSPLSGGETGGLSVLGGNGGNPVDIPVTTTTAVVTEPSTVTRTVTTEVTASATAGQSEQPQTPATTATTSSPAATTSSALPSQTPTSTGESPAATPNSVASTATGSTPTGAG